MSEIRATTISDETGNGPIRLTKQSAAKAWVDGLNDATISASFNVASGTDHGTGDYSYTLTSSMFTADYSFPVAVITGSYDRNASANGNRITSSVMAIQTANSRLNSASDQSNNGVAHGDLA